MYLHGNSCINESFVSRIDPDDTLVCSINCNECGDTTYFAICDVKQEAQERACCVCGKRFVMLTAYHLTTNVDNYNLKESLVETLDDFHDVLVKAMNMSLLYWCDNAGGIESNNYHHLLDFMLRGTVKTNPNRNASTVNRINGQIGHYIDRFFTKKYVTNFMFGNTLLKKEAYTDSLSKLYVEDINIESSSYVLVSFTKFNLVLPRSIFSDVFFDSLLKEKGI